MKLVPLFLIFFFASLVTPARVNCPTTATCAEHGINGNPTGQYKWVGETEYAQFHHVAVGNAPAHSWWEKCD